MKKTRDPYPITDVYLLEMNAVNAATVTVGDLCERHFFGLPLHNRVDIDRLKKIKKEYFEKKKKLKKSS